MEKTSQSVRLTPLEKKALKKALQGFKGEIYLFGSRLDPNKKGGDIDLLLVPYEKVNPIELELQVQTKFFMECEEDIDVLVYRDTPFFQEILKNAKKLNLEEL